MGKKKESNKLIQGTHEHRLAVLKEVEREKCKQILNSLGGPFVVMVGAKHAETILDTI